MMLTFFIHAYGYDCKMGHVSDGCDYGPHPHVCGHPTNDCVIHAYEYDYGCVTDDDRAHDCISFFILLPLSFSRLSGSDHAHDCIFTHAYVRAYARVYGHARGPDDVPARGRGNSLDVHRVRHQSVILS